MSARRHPTAEQQLRRPAFFAPNRRFAERLARRFAQLGGSVEAIRRYAAEPAPH